jgi:hypothetical protein
MGAVPRDICNEKGKRTVIIDEFTVISGDGVGWRRAARKDNTSRDERGKQKEFLAS